MDILCINQLIFITHEIYKSLDDGYEVWAVFLDISKAFDKIWHQGLHYKLKQNGISGKLWKTLTDFIVNRTQRVILNAQYFLWAKVEAGAPQGFNSWATIVFNLYQWFIWKFSPKLFADDTSFFSIVKNVDASNIDLNNDLKKIDEWVFQWKMNFSVDPTKQAQELIFLAKCKWLIILLYPNLPSKALKQFF